MRVGDSECDMRIPSGLEVCDGVWAGGGGTLHREVAVPDGVDGGGQEGVLVAKESEKDGLRDACGLAHRSGGDVASDRASQPLGCLI